MLDIKESGIWNIGTGQTMSFRDIAEKYTTNIVEVSMPDVLQSNYQAYTCADMSKTHETLRKNNILTDEIEEFHQLVLTSANKG